MSDEKLNERRRFIAESAREFIARRFHSAEGLMPETIPEAVRLASSLADELEKQDAAPWSRTIDVDAFVKDSVPALPPHAECGYLISASPVQRCHREKGHKGIHKTEYEIRTEG